MNKLVVTLGVSSLALTGCASGINSLQEKELKYYESQNMAVEEKSEGLAFGLGFLPGIGSMYAGEYGYGMLNLLLWPASIFWDPISGANAAARVNYEATMLNVNNLKRKEMDNLYDLYQIDKLTEKQYTIQKHQIERKYTPVMN